MSQRRYGMPIEEWESAGRALSSLLEDAAAHRRTVTYGEAARRVFGGRFSARSGALMALLDAVDSATMDARGVMIASLVVRADTGRPGEGYFVFAEKWERAPIQDREAYWTEQADRVWTAYAEPDRS